MENKNKTPDYLRYMKVIIVLFLGIILIVFDTYFDIPDTAGIFYLVIAMLILCKDENKFW